jgi:hypothetical protein
MNDERPKLTVIPCTAQKAMGQDMLNEIQEVMDKPKYDHMTNATVIGVLELVKLHYWYGKLDD